MLPFWEAVIVFGAKQSEAKNLSLVSPQSVVRLMRFLTRRFSPEANPARGES